MSWTIERFARQHDRTGFSCGKPQLDDFLARFVSQYERRSLGRTYVLVRDGGPRVFGYSTLAASQMEFAELPPETSKNLPRHAVPCLLLGRLAVDQSVRGQGLGGMLLNDALTRSLELAERIGIFAVVVDAIDAAAAGFYGRFGFLPLVGHPNRLFLPVDTIRQSGAG